MDKRTRAILKQERKERKEIDKWKYKSFVLFKKYDKFDKFELDDWGYIKCGKIEFFGQASSKKEYKELEQNLKNTFNKVYEIE